MIRPLLLVAFSLLTTTCVDNESPSKQYSSPPDTPSPYAFDGSKLTTDEPKSKLDERFPQEMRNTFAEARRIDVFETELCSGAFAEKLKPKERGKFQGCKVLRRTAVTIPALRKQFVEEVVSAIGSHHSGNACFDPHHGIRAEHQGKRVELLICFECENFRGTSSTGSFGGGFSPAVKDLFERTLLESK